MRAGLRFWNRDGDGGFDDDLDDRVSMSGDVSGEVLELTMREMFGGCFEWLRVYNYKRHVFYSKELTKTN